MQNWWPVTIWAIFFWFIAIFCNRAVLKARRRDIAEITAHLLAGTRFPETHTVKGVSGIIVWPMAVGYLKL